MNYLTISFWILTIIWIALLLISLHKMSPKGNIKARDITFHALIIALIVVMGFVPEAGYISFVPGISFSLIHLPVLLGAYHKGWKGGIIYGIAFGVTSWIQGMMSGVGFNALFAMPWVSIPPRLLFGFFALFRFLALLRFSFLVFFARDRNDHHKHKQGCKSDKQI